MNEQLDMMIKGRQFKHLMEVKSTRIRKEWGLKRMEMEVLYFLGIAGEHNTSADIFHFLNANKGHISQTVDSLCRQGYLKAVPDQKDRRYVHYFLTDQANEVVLRIKQEWEMVNQRLMEGISEEEMAVYNRISVKMKENMENMLAE